MKRILPVILCVFLVAALATPALAAGTTSFSMSVSDSTLQRGDAVTFTVSVSSSEPATSYGFMLSYDNTVFELVNGKCTVDGTLVSSFKNGFAFMFQSATDYSGKVGTVTLRVKENAPLGDFKVSGSASVKNGTNPISASGASRTISVACVHNYGSWSAAGSSNHQRTCSICKNVETTNHTWNSGVVTKQPNCKETGIKTLNCTTCSEQKTEAIEKTNDHSYGKWTKLDATSHIRTCVTCQENEVAAHTWNSGTVTKQPSCKEKGEKTFTCTGCSATKKEEIARTVTHNFSGGTKVNDSTHKYVCTVCQKEESANHSWNSGSVKKQATCKEEGIKIFACAGCNATKSEPIAKLTTHTYDHACDTNCNVCGVLRAVSHDYKTSWSKDKNSHWHECAVCKDKQNVTAHTPGAEATERKAQTCTKCGYVIKAAHQHTHKYADTWTTDESGHWYACADCDEKNSQAAHDFENACDPDCGTCGFIREAKHTFEENWITDVQNHWHVCIGCGLKRDETAHEPGAEATATTAQTCIICDYEIAPVLEETEAPTETPTEATKATVADTEMPTQTEDVEFPWWIVIVVTTAVTAAGAVVIVVKKKKT